jgi:CheY-like chemotaxis protein
LDHYKEIKKDIPIIVISGSFGRQIQKESFEKGALKYITKPFNEKDLLQTIRECLPPHS